MASRKAIPIDAERREEIATASERTPDKKAAKYAAEIIRLKILDGLLSPGQRLIEPDLMSELDVGRSTIREAFLKLESEGYVELRHQRGAIVRRMTRRDMIELFEVRERLEGMAASLCAANINREGYRTRVRELREVWKQQSVRRDSVEHMSSNVELHRGIIMLADNQRLIRILEPLQVPGYRIQFLALLDQERRDESVEDHLAILDAILAGDGAKAERLMREHVRRAGKLAAQIPGLLD
jgi:DNA-binding GntR family transcriptional regulator